MPSQREDTRERLIRVFAEATFLIFFQAYMVAPLLPHLAGTFRTSVQTVGFIVPAYLIPYGTATLIYGLLSDRLGRRRIVLGSLLAFVVLTALTATSQSVPQLLCWRLLTGLGASGVVPLALVVIGALYPYEQRGRPLGWLFGAMAGGMAFGSTFGALLAPLVGWRGITRACSPGSACTSPSGINSAMPVLVSRSSGMAFPASCLARLLDVPPTGGGGDG